VRITKKHGRFFTRIPQISANSRKSRHRVSCNSWRIWRVSRFELGGYAWRRDSKRNAASALRLPKPRSVS